MKAATIVPQHHLHLIAWQDYHLALAHLINKPGFEYYTKFYGDMAGHPEKFVILDNGLIEGDPRPMEELLDKALQIGADELVLPDVFQNREETYRKVYDSLNKLVHGNARVRTMAVAQGKTVEEWLASARELLKLPINTLGIPKVVAKLPDATGKTSWIQRLNVLQLLADDLEKSDVQVHLLGCWDTPLEIKTIAAAIAGGTCPEVRGTDSAIAYAFARKGMKMSEGDRPVGAIDFGATDLDPDDVILKYNIQMWQHECGDIDLSSEDLHIPRFW